MPKTVGAPTLDDALAVLREWAEEGESRGERNIIFCEDRMTLLSERAVLERLGGTFLTDVTTFARFLSGSASVLSKYGSVMQISAIISENKEELSCFGESSAQVVYETIAQLSASRVTAEMLREGARETDGLLSKKLLDLALVQEKYQQFLTERDLVDENGYLALLPDRIAREARGANVCFFAFPSFTRQAQEGVRSALEHAKSVTGIFLAGREEFYTNEGARIFRRLCEERGETQNKMVRSSLEGDAFTLSRGLFSPDRFAQEEKEDAQAVYLFSETDEEREVARVAAYIRKHVAEGLRFRDIAVLVSDAEMFPVIEKTFTSYQIAYFADKKRAFSEHPFCRFTLDVFEAVADGVLPHEADAIASSVYFGDGDSYRNYLLKFGTYRGAVRREIKEGEAVKDYDRETLLACREKMLEILALFPRKAKASAYVHAVRALYALVEGERVTQELQERFDGAEREFLSAQPLESVLNEIQAVTGERIFTARDFSAMLKSGLDSCSVSMIPQYADAVFVGDATESKFARVKVLFATGMTDSLPRASEDTAVISDGEIDRLSQLQVEIEPAIAQVNARARESLALNLCSFTQALYVSYPVQLRGEETAKSEVVSYLNRLFRLPPAPDSFPFDCCERQPALLKLLSLRSLIEEGKIVNGEEYSILYEALKTCGEGERTEKLLTGGEKSNISCGERLYFAHGFVSPTLLETYFSCPYSGFAMRGIHLREREERGVLDTDTGTFVHTVLEEVAKKLNVIASEGECRKYAEEQARTLLKAPRYASLVDTAAGEYTAEQLVSESVEVSAVMYRQLEQSKFKVYQLEGKVTIPELSLYGKADRVDSSGDFIRIIDYKTGAIDDKPTSYYVGKKLQLQLYLKGMLGDKRPAGAFYFPASVNYTKPEDEKYRMLGFYCSDQDSVSAMDTSLQEGEKSTLFEGSLGGKQSEKGMSSGDFIRFLDYATLVSASAEREMKEGNVKPSPYDGACSYCRLRGLCGYDGEPRKVSAVKCEQIVKAVKELTGEAQDEKN